MPHPSPAPRTLPASLDAALAPLDRLRSAWLAWMAPRARALLVDREARVAANGSASMLASLLAAVLAPVWLIVLGPLVWGVPHLLADVRYLVARPGLHRRGAPWLAIGIPVALASLTSLGVRAGLLGALGGVVAARGIATARRVALGTLVTALLVIAWQVPRAADLVFVHAHNVVAIALFWTWRRRAKAWHLAPLALFAAACAWILFGRAEPLVDSLGGWHPDHGGAPLGVLLNAYAPWPMHLALARRVVLLFAFAQSAHYAVWLRLIPDEARPSTSPRSFRQSTRALLADVGPWVLLVAVALGAAFPLLAWAGSAQRARDLYLHVALFHGHLELGVAALLWAEGRRP